MKKLDELAEKHYKGVMASCAIVCFMAIIMGVAFINSDNIALATSGWKDNLVLKANRNIAVTGQEKTEEVLALKIDADVSSDIELFIVQQQEFQKKSIQEYYDTAVSELSNGSLSEELKNQIINIRENLLIEHKKEIDAALDQYKNELQ